MINANAIAAAARETHMLLEQIAYEAINYDTEDFSGEVLVDLDEMFENVDDLTDEDMEVIAAHEASVWASVAARVHAIDPDWEVDFQNRSFVNDAAFREAIMERAAARQERADMVADYYRMCGVC